MNKILIKNEIEYRQFAFDVLNDFPEIHSLEESLGVIIQRDCWETDKDGNDLDEKGNIIPDDFSSPEKLILTEEIKNLKYPIIIIHWLESGFDRHGDVTISAIEFVSRDDFNKNC